MAKENADLVATTFKRLRPISYLSRFLDASIREDGRPLAAFRDATITLGSISTADGSSFVRIGNTSCIAAIKAEVATPQLSRPREGYLIPNVELPAVCSSKFKPGAPRDEAQVLTSRLLALLNSSNLLDRQLLCIQDAIAVWCLYLDISFICFDGNAMDAAVLAAVSALSDSKFAIHTYTLSHSRPSSLTDALVLTPTAKTAKLPAATYDPDTEQVRCSSSRTALHLEHVPFASSFSIFENQYLLSDPTAFESALSSSHATVAVLLNPSALPKSSKAKPTITYLHQSGRLSTTSSDSTTSATDQHILQLCIDRSYSRAKQLASLLHDAQLKSP